MTTYDAIVVGARVAGSVTALLLSRRGLKVLVVDRARFPSDTLSTHQVQVPGVARLLRWGVLERLVDAGTPPAARLRFDAPGAVLHGRFPACGGADAVYSPRRTILDAALLGAARAAGAEVWEGFAVTGLIRTGAAVAGVRGTWRGDGTETTARARLVIGADGKHSLVAREVGAAAYHEGPARSVACYTYWSGVGLDGGEIYARDRRAVGAWPTNDGLVMTYAAWPAAEFEEIRADVEGNLWKTLDQAGDLGERVRSGERAERIRCTNDLPNRFRVPHGPGWALVGDAGLVMDPITGQGIADAFRDAELLADAVATGIAGGRLERALARYRRRRDRAALPMYRLTQQLARLAPARAADRELFSALAARPAEIERFFGVLTGVHPPAAVFSPPHLIRLLGPRRFLRVAREMAAR
jgi:2-polyprenyl-6-methoxyphenol hydroxylase-like FAD-dependent oxidoreductase